MNARLFYLLLLMLAASAVPGQGRERLKVVETYEYDAEQYEADPRTARKHLANVAFHDRAGRVVERWDLVNASDGAYYERHVLMYDRGGRNVADLVHASAKGAPGRYFSIARTGRTGKILPALPETFSRATMKWYDRAGHTVKVEISDADGKLTRRYVHAHNAAGDPVAYRDENGDGSVACESTTTYSEDNLSSVQMYRNCGPGSTRKVVSRRDPSKRPVLEEQFSAAPDGSLVLTSRSLRTYSGEMSHMDWTLFSNTGEPRSRLLIVDKGDDEISRKEFSADGASESGRPRWRPSEEVTYEHIRDGAGTLTKTIRRQRPSPDIPFRISDVTEHVVTFVG